MNKKKDKHKQFYKSVIALLLGVFVAGTATFAATILSSSEVGYKDNSNLGVDNVQDAIDKLSTKADIRNRNNIVSAYTYDSRECVTGEEDTCVRTDCYKDTTANSCKAGDIIKYKVNDTDIVTFHVMYDNGTTLTMQSQKNTINNTQWISASDYTTENTDGTSCSADSCSDEGPLTVLTSLERVTKTWINVNDQTYTMGTTVFKDNSFTGCNSYNSCTVNTYTLSSRTAKARMITLQEASGFGCTTTNKSCPNWMNNYLFNSISYGGTVSDDSVDPSTKSVNYGYWTMSARPAGDAWRVITNGLVIYIGTYDVGMGARAVVEINK